MRAIFFNGLGTGETRRREAIAFKYLRKHGIAVVHHHIDWLSGEGFESLLQKAAALTRDILDTNGSVVLIGSSAGGSMAINVFSQLQDHDVFAISLCGRLHPGAYQPTERLSLENKAGIGKPHESQSFYDSVVYCDQKAIPAIKSKNLHRAATVRQIADGVVPPKTMEIIGVQPIFVPGFGHGMGILLGALQLPKIIKRFIV